MLAGVSNPKDLNPDLQKKKNEACFLCITKFYFHITELQRQCGMLTRQLQPKHENREADIISTPPLQEPMHKFAHQLAFRGIPCRLRRTVSH